MHANAARHFNADRGTDDYPVKKDGCDCEIDVIDQETLYKLFEWVALPYSKLILIGIVITHTNLQAASNTLEGRAEQSAGQSKSEMLAASKILWWLCTTNSTVLVFL